MKKLLTLIAACAGLLAFAGTLDGSSDEALTKSLVTEWQALNDADTARLGMALFSAYEQLRDMPPAQRNAKLNGKNVEDVIAIAKELSPGDFSGNEAIFRQFSEKDKAVDAAAIRRFLATVKPEKGFKAMLATVHEPLSVGSGSVVFSRIVADAVESLPPEKALLFIAVYSEIDTPEGFANFVNTLAADGPAAVVEKFKESDPEAYKDAAQKVERLSPEDVKEIGKKIAAQARSFANDKMKEWESLDVPKPSELNWLTDFEAAKKQATAENKPMFVLFTGSDWCPWCIKLERELLSSPEFGKYAKDNLVMVMVDFPRGKEIAPAQAAANQKLSEQYNVSGFPTVLLMNAEGKVIGESGYEKLSPQKYVESVKKILNKK